MTYTDDQIDERIRATASLNTDASWRDVRRRARRKQAPLAVAVGAMAAVVLATPALAFRHELADLWESAEPARNLYVRTFADCGEGNFTLEFDPAGEAVARQGDETLARASETERTIECDASIQTSKGVRDSSPYHGDLDKRSYSPVALECSVDVPFQVAVHPIWDGEVIRGSTMVVADRGTQRVFASAVFKRDAEGRNWSRTYWTSGVCDAPGGYDPTVPAGVASPG